MGATSGINSNLTLAVGTNLSGRLSGSFLFLLLTDIVQGVHQLDDAEQNDSDDEEVDDSHNQGAVLEDNAVNGKGQAAEILLKDDTDQGRNQVGNQGVNDGLECSTDHNTDGHVNNVAAIDKRSELR